MLCEGARVCAATCNPEEGGGVCRRAVDFSLLLTEFGEVNGVT